MNLTVLISALLGTLFSPVYAGVQWDEKQVADYVHYSEFQRRASWRLLAEIKFRGDEHILDVGCGDGRNTAMMSRLVPYGKVIGVDPSSAMIDWAERQYHPFEFPNLSFFKGDSNLFPTAIFDVITSFFSFHMIENKQSVARIFFKRLSEKGSVFAVIPSHGKNSEFSTAFEETIKDPKWEPYFRNFQPIFKYEELESYIDHFKRAGFLIVRAEYISAMDPFVNREEAIRWFLGTYSHIHYLPEGLREQFFSDVIDRYFEKRPSAFLSNGAICFYWGQYELIAQKKVESP
jgi:trans-aconitate methyltransferase